MSASSQSIPTVVIENVHPEIDGGRFPVKREVGDTFEVWADIFRHGHDVIAAALQYRQQGEERWCEAPMRLLDNDRWSGQFVLGENTRYYYTVEAWRNTFATWRAELRKKVEAHQDVSSELTEGRSLVVDAVARAVGDAKGLLAALLDRWDRFRPAKRLELALSDGLARLMAECADRADSTRYDREFEVVVDRAAARFGAWYELFPRSQGTDPRRGATLREAEARLPAVAQLGFDILYLPPIHPIGTTNRKGANNSLVAGPDDPGSPWAIGNAFGGHKSVDPELGTLGDFDHFVQSARSLGLEVALDFAIQCSPDHPYVNEHPGWFYHRPDGTIKFAENPPKKYEDIYPLDLLCADREALWQELKSIVLFWIARGVKIFRVDNPHTKPVAFWQWLISGVQRDYPETIFLAEAFTMPKMMKYLAKVGFTQSYTYFTWRDTKAELTDYLTELTQTEMGEYYRGNFFANTPDILPWSLQRGRPAAFKIRLVLAATLSASYGIYNGFELCEDKAIPGREEYLDSEKYQHKVWDWDRPGNIAGLIARVNAIRHANPALHTDKNLRFHPIDDESMLAYGKMTANKSNAVLVIVNLDPFRWHEATLSLPIWEYGIGADEQYMAEDLLTGARYFWQGERQYIRLDPECQPAHIFAIRRKNE